MQRGKNLIRPMESLYKFQRRSMAEFMRDRPIVRDSLGSYGHYALSKSDENFIVNYLATA